MIVGVDRFLDGRDRLESSREYRRERNVALGMFCFLVPRETCWRHLALGLRCCCLRLRIEGELGDANWSELKFTGMERTLLEIFVNWH